MKGDDLEEFAEDDCSGRDSQSDRQRDGQTERRTDRETDRQTKEASRHRRNEGYTKETRVLHALHGDLRLKTT